MAFANPLWFAGLLGLGVPIVIHLMGRRAARTVRLPSLRALEETPVARALTTRVDDPWRLLLRCLLLALVVLALAEPRVAVRRGDGAMALVDTTRAAARALGDSLGAAGVAVRPLPAGLDAWSALLDAARETRGPLHVVAPLTAGQLGAARPALDNDVTWHDVPAGDPPPFARERTVLLLGPLDAASGRRLDAALGAIADELELRLDVRRSETAAVDVLDALRPTDLVVTLGDAPLATAARVARLDAATLAGVTLPVRLAKRWFADAREAALARAPVRAAAASPATGDWTLGGGTTRPRWLPLLWVLPGLALLADRALAWRRRPA